MAEGNRSRRAAQASSAFTFTLRDDGIGIIGIDVPGEKQNTLKPEFGPQFEAVLEQVRAQPGLKGLVLYSTKPGRFVAGADVGLFDTLRSAADAAEASRGCQRLFRAIEALPVPAVAAIDGVCLGGGLELALACRARICADSPSTRLGLPEVMLGLLPGAGGTQRLPRLIGIAAALDLMLTGKALRPARARRIGLVDAVVPPGILLDAAARHALALAQNKTAVWRTERRPAALRAAAQSWALERNALGRRLLFRQARMQTRAKTLGNYPAPERIIDVVETGWRRGIEAGYAAEAQAFGELAMSAVSRQCRGLFLAQNALKKARFVDGAPTETRRPQRVGVLGGGLMGSGIALVSASNAGHTVRLKDRDARGLGYGHAYLQKFYDKRVRRGAITAADAAAERARVTLTDDYSGFGQLDIVVEAVFEDLALKQRMLRDVEAHARSDTIFASNTSSIPIADIARAAKRPQNVIGLHYFSPVEKMPLLEIIATEQTSPDVVAACVAFGQAQGKTVIVVRDGPGFYTTRILAPYLNEATRILAEGVEPKAVDRALTQYGYPIGPVSLLDEVGIDVGTKVAPILAAAFGERMLPPPQSGAMIEAGFLGRKSGRGFYVYDGKGAGKRAVNPGLRRLGIAGGKTLPAQEIAERCTLAMANEAVFCLQDGVLFAPMHGDIGAVFGLGFPPFRGGPFRYLDAMGIDQAVARLQQLSERYGPRFAPAPLLVDMARGQRRFHP
jgi:3-hydroxyacyl-CoA dehydrogenase / enoyl-CoA hydratase / 3-hydroxybutyryl-CoA epimerase